MFAQLQKHMKEHFLQEYFVKLQEKADAAALFQILKATRAATNEENYLSSREVCSLL